MKFPRLLLCLLTFLQISSSLSTLSEVWEKFMTFSCEFSSEIEKFIPKDNERSRRSILDEDPNFDNPEELFAYLYPLADLKPEDLLQEAQRSSSSSTFQSNSIYAWAMDLGNLWMGECRIRSGRESHEDDEEDDEDGEEGKRNTTFTPQRQSRSLFGEANENSGSSKSINSQRILSSSLHSEGPAQGVYDQPLFSQHQIRTQRTNRTSGKTKRKLPSLGAANRKLVTVNISSSNATTTTTTAAPDTTTTAAPDSSDDNFFSSYGGDIEYFFPLISFGIPFDGEITFLGFHGFKGLFPYK